MSIIKGINRYQGQILSYDEMVSETSMARIIDKFVSVNNTKEEGFGWAGEKNIGRPAYPIEGLIKLYVYGYTNGIRSSRKLEQEPKRNIEVMWMMDGLTPDHKCISEFRRQNLEPLKDLFKRFVKLCREWDLVSDEIIAVDGTTIRANNNSYKNFNLKKVSNKIKEIDEKIQQYFDAMDTEDYKEDIEKLNQSRAKYESLMKQLEEKQISSLSLTDCDASLVCDKKGGLMPGYNVQSAVDSQNDIVVEIDTNQNVVDCGQLSVMVEKIQKKSIKKDFIAIADCGYWKGEDLAKTEHLGVIPLIGVPKNPQRHDQPEPYKTNKFLYDRKNDKYICPEGKYLFCHQIRGKGFKRYFNKEACFNCLCKSECCKLNKLGFKTINRSNYADAIDRNTERIKNNKKLYHRRWELAEHPFGTIKRTLNGGYYLLRGLQKVSTETALMFLGYNIRRVFNVIGFTKMMAKLEAI